jgi:transposase
LSSFYFAKIKPKTKLCEVYINVPITLFLDNARYQKCALVTATAARLQIELCFLPPYSPNLNLIERLWRFVKKQCLYSTYYPTTAALNPPLPSA